MASPMDTDEDVTSRGVKRKADGTTAPNPPRRIQPLAQDVVNKIAAGEIIVAPVHALKEMLENAVDAGATSIEITVKDGGLKMLQITDNGHGIHRDDMPLLCERFTTSKLKKFEDLSSIGTYGFRGEALASISHIAHLSVTTKTEDSSCAWKAQYEGGKLAPLKPGQSADPKPSAGRQGTQITVEDLFYNIPTRRRAFRSASEEYAKILEMVGKHAIHCSGVAFATKKHGENSMGVSVPAAANTIERIRQIHGGVVANELIEVKAAGETLGFKVEGLVSNANYSGKKTTLLLFINHRAVESSTIKKAIEQTYATFLPKGGHPFVYLSLEIEPHRVDVNVHPTKREVRFLYEDEIIELVCDEIRTGLGNVDTSRTFMTQSLLAGGKSSLSTMAPPPAPQTPGSGSATPKTPGPRSTTQKPYENNLVRTDSKARKITSMLSLSRNASADGTIPEDSHPASPIYTTTDKEPTICRLTTVKELRASVREEMHNTLTDVIASHTYIGVVDHQRRMAAIQSGVKLYLVDYGLLSSEYFYQLGVTDFANFGSIRLSPPLELGELLRIGAEGVQQAEGAFPHGMAVTDVVARVHKTLLDRRAMLSEYFSIDISEDGRFLLGLPLLVKGYIPPLAKLPQFLLRLGPFVDWTDEKACFHSFLKEMASFHVPESLPTPAVKGLAPGAKSSGIQVQSSGKGKEKAALQDPATTESQDAVEDPIVVQRREQVDRLLENVLFPAFKARLVATKGMLRGVVEVADLKGLYRIFERC